MCGVTEDAYADDELARLYDLAHDGYDEDLALYEQFARRGGRVLELGVGSGRVALRLADAGYDVVGLDASPAMLGRLRKRIHGDIVQRLRVVEGDMRDFDLGGERFGLICCALGTFGHLIETGEQVAALRCVARHLEPDGVFVAQVQPVTGVDWDAGGAVRLGWTRTDADTGEMISLTRSMTASAARQTTTETLIFDRIGGDGTVRRRTVDVTLRAFGRFEVELLLERAGLRLTGVYGGPDLSPFDDASDTMVLVGELESTARC